MYTEADSMRDANVAYLADATPTPKADSMDTFLSSVESQALGMASVRLRDREDALDAVQDAMLRLATRYADKPPEEWTPLFWSILRRRIIDMQRRRKVRSIMQHWMHGPDRDDGPPAWQPVDHGPGSQQVLSDEQAMTELETALRNLPQRQYEAFSLRVLNQMDGQTTARIMGCSEGSVKTHLSRARAVLRERLEDWK